MKTIQSIMEEKVDTERQPLHCIVSNATELQQQQIAVKVGNVRSEKLRLALTEKLSTSISEGSFDTVLMKCKALRECHDRKHHVPAEQRTRRPGRPRKEEYSATGKLKKRHAACHRTPHCLVTEMVIENFDVLSDRDIDDFFRFFDSPGTGTREQTHNEKHSKQEKNIFIAIRDDTGIHSRDAKRCFTWLNQVCNGHDSSDLDPRFTDIVLGKFATMHLRDGRNIIEHWMDQSSTDMRTSSKTFRRILKKHVSTEYKTKMRGLTPKQNVLKADSKSSDGGTKESDSKSSSRSSKTSSSSLNTGGSSSSSNSGGYVSRSELSIPEPLPVETESEPSTPRRSVEDLIRSSKSLTDRQKKDVLAQCEALDRRYASSSLSSGISGSFDSSSSTSSVSRRTTNSAWSTNSSFTGSSFSSPYGSYPMSDLTRSFNDLYVSSSRTVSSSHAPIIQHASSTYRPGQIGRPPKTAYNYHSNGDRTINRNYK